MNKMLLCVFLTCLCLPAWAAGNAGNKELYKCLVNGKVRYTDRLPNAKARCEALFTRKQPTGALAEAPATVSADAGSGKPAAVDDAAKAPAKMTETDKELEAKRKKLGEEGAKAKEDQKLAQQQIRDQNCRNAKINIQTLQFGRVSRYNEKGEKYYLDDAAIASELAQAKKDAEQWCNK